MLLAAIAVASTLVLMAIIQVASGLALVRQFFLAPPSGFAEERWPKAAVLLALRGADPRLRETIRGLLTLDYPDYEVHVIVDSKEDPAWDVVHRTISEFDTQRATVSPLLARGTTCGLQCSAFVQAGRSLDASVEVLATIDGDVVVHDQWLRELVAPLQNERVGATFGNRWFIPTGSQWGSLVRYLWNVAAVVPMYLFEIPWGGTFAIRRSAVDESQLFERWSKAIVHDAPVKSLLDELGLHIRFVPSLMMPIKENCSLAFCFDFLKRQLMWTRIYHPNWLLMVLHALLTTLLLAGSATLAAAGVALAQWQVAAAAGGGFVGYLLVMLLLISVLEATVRTSLQKRGVDGRWLSAGKLVKLPLAILLTQAVYVWALMLAGFRQTVVWRGVTYLIRSRWDVEIVAEERFDDVGRAAGESL